MNDPILSMFGLARKAGKLSLGHDACKGAINSGKAKLCIICSDASERLLGEMQGLAENASVQVVNLPYTMLDIKQATGFKAAVFTVDDEGFAKSILKKINDNHSGKELGL